MLESCGGTSPSNVAFAGARDREVERGSSGAGATPAQRRWRAKAAPPDTGGCTAARARASQQEALQQLEKSAAAARLAVDKRKRADAAAQRASHLQRPEGAGEAAAQPASSDSETDSDESDGGGAAVAATAPVPPPPQLSPPPWARSRSPWAHLVVRGPVADGIDVGRRWQHGQRVDTWGNDFVMVDASNAERVRVVQAHAKQLTEQGPRASTIVAARQQLCGRTLSCHCAPQACMPRRPAGIRRQLLR